MFTLTLASGGKSSRAIVEAQPVTMEPHPGSMAQQPACRTGDCPLIDAALTPSPKRIASQTIVSLGHFEQMLAHVLIDQAHCKIAAVVRLFAKVAGHGAGGSQRPQPTVQFSSAAWTSGGSPRAASTSCRK